MKNLLPKLLFYYCVLAALLITVSLVLTSTTIGPVVFAMLFLPVTGYFVAEFFRQIRSGSSPQAPRRSEILLVLIIFLLLLGLGIRNIYINKKTGSQEVLQTSPSPLIFKTSPTPETANKLTISITDGSPTVNIREKPTIYSEKVGEAKDGDTFTYTQKTGEWYEVILESGTLGYVSFKYVKEINQ